MLVLGTTALQTKPGQKPDSTVPDSFGQGLRAGTESLMDRAADFVARVIKERELFERGIDKGVLSRSNLLDTTALKSLEVAAREVDAFLLKAKLDGKELSGEQNNQHADVNNKLLKLTAEVFDACIHASSNKRIELVRFLNGEGQFSFESADALAKIGQLQTLAGELFTPLGLRQCNFRVVDEFKKAFGS